MSPIHQFVRDNIVSIAALLISLWSLYYSCQSRDIAESELHLNYHPILNVDFDIDNFRRKYSINIYNDGVNSITEIRIVKSTRVWNATKELALSEMTSKVEWHVFPELEPMEEKEFTIDYIDITNSHAFGKNFTADSDFILPVEVYEVSFRRLPDRKYYRVRKYLLIMTNGKDGSPMPMDPDEQRFRDFIDLRKSLNSYDNSLE